MDDKPIAIAFSDLHLHKFNQFNDKIKGINGRLYQSLQVMKFMGQKAQQLGVPILFGGDLFHNNEELENEVGSLTLKYYKKYISDLGVKFFGLSGNHDFSERNGLDHRSPTHLRKLTVFPGFSLLDDFDTAVTPDGVVIQGVPYMDNDADTVKEIKNRSNELGMYKDKTKILLLHQDFPGAKTPAGFECKEYNALNVNLNKLFKPWDFVLCGHIHKPQQIAKNAWMMGSPIHQISSDEGTNMGYWIIYRNRKPRFIGLNDLFPVFITIKHDEQVEDTHDYYLRLPKDDLVEKKVKKHKFNVNNDRSQLALSYSKVKGIKNKSKIKALKKILSEV